MLEKEIMSIINIVCTTIAEILTLSLIAGLTALVWRLVFDKDAFKK